MQFRVTAIKADTVALLTPNPVRCNHLCITSVFEYTKLTVVPAAVLQFTHALSTRVGTHWAVCPFLGLRKRNTQKNMNRFLVTK
jgi:hypothetical protein